MSYLVTNPEDRFSCDVVHLMLMNRLSSDESGIFISCIPNKYVTGLYKALPSNTRRCKTTLMHDVKMSF